MQDLGNEILLYDLKIDKAFCLNETAAIVFRHCDGSTSPADLKLKKGDLSEEVIFLTLDLLEKENLLKVKDYQSPFDGLSRRAIIKKVGLASMVAWPVISSIMAPPAAAAQSGSCFNAPVDLMKLILRVIVVTAILDVGTFQLAPLVFPLVKCFSLRLRRPTMTFVMLKFTKIPVVIRDRLPETGPGAIALNFLPLFFEAISSVTG